MSSLCQHHIYTISFLVNTLLFQFQYLNIKLTEVSVPDPDKYPHMVSVMATVSLDGAL